MATTSDTSTINVCDNDKIGLLPHRQPQRRVLHTILFAFAIVTLGSLGVVLTAPSHYLRVEEEVLPSENLLSEMAAANASSNATIEVYLGNGCFWERQWAYYKVETEGTGPFKREPVAFTAKVGYAGGRALPSHAPTKSVCYHTGDSRDYSSLGHAEAVRVTLVASSANDQMRALAADFFGSFIGGYGQRGRPDPMDRGTPYRSFVGLPGGISSWLYAVLAAENTHGMSLKLGNGADGDEFNTVWVYDTDKFPFWDGEVYHQNHCNFFPSEGMPYPDEYTTSLWGSKRTRGEYKPTGCPEQSSSRRCGGGEHRPRR